MAINLQKGQRINLKKENGAELSQACVGINWGAIEKKDYSELKRSSRLRRKLYII